MLDISSGANTVWILQQRTQAWGEKGNSIKQLFVHRALWSARFGVEMTLETS